MTDIDSTNIETIRTRAFAADASTSIVIIEEALKKNIKVSLPFDNFKIIWLYLNDSSTPTEIRKVSTHNSSQIGSAITIDKALSYKYAQLLGMHVLPWICTNEIEEAISFFDTHNEDCIIKPVRGQGGNGIRTRFDSREDFTAFFESTDSTDKLIIQKKAPGKCDLRLLFIGNKFCAATSTIPTYLIGDGISTLGELIALENAEREKSNVSRYPSMLLKELYPNAALRMSGKTADYIVPVGESVEASLSNSTKGGISVDVTKTIHPSFIEDAQKLVDVLHLTTVAVDFIATDYEANVEGNAYFLEANSSPGIDLHIYPHRGEGVNAAGIFIDFISNM